jgi:hypothetical protein
MLNILKNNLRYERKWVFKDVNYNDIFNKALKSKFLFHIQHPKRHVNSIYFDDNNYTSIKDNLDGVSDRSKYRVRWYGKNSFVLHNPKLEIKIKKNFLNYKKIFPLEKLDNLNIKNINHVKLINNEVNNTIKKKLLFANLTTHYERLYLVSLNKKIRATIDYNLNGTNFNCYFQNPISKERKDVIVELKYDQEYDSYVRRNLQNISSRFSKNSKYINFALE